MPPVLGARLRPAAPRVWVTNEIVRPVPLAGTLPAASGGINNTRWFGNGTGAHSVVEQATPWGPRFARKTWSTAATNNGDTGFDVRPRSGTGVLSYGVPVSAGEVITGWAALRSSAGGQLANIVFYHHDEAGAFTTRLSGSGVTLTASTWGEIGFNHTVPTGVFYVTMMADINVGGPLWAAGNTLDCAGVALYRGHVPPTFGWGDSRDWSWSGTAYQSASSGPL
jgi:hypothetical protein